MAAEGVAAVVVVRHGVSTKSVEFRCAGFRCQLLLVLRGGITDKAMHGRTTTAVVCLPGSSTKRHAMILLLLVVVVVVVVVVAVLLIMQSVAT